MSKIPETMHALIYDRELDPWESSTGLRKVELPTPRLEPDTVPQDRSSVLIRSLYTGFCGSDRGIWFRKAFHDMIYDSVAEEDKSFRVVGHELLGEIVEVGDGAASKYGYQVGDVVSTESHLVCGSCYQCRVGQNHVCAEDKIIGISVDGCFADYLKLPAKALWSTNLDRIRPEVAAIQEPFGNAVHACTKVDLRGKSVAIFGTGTIGLFAVLIARGLGAGRIIGIDPNPLHAGMARRLGADEVIEPDIRGADPVAADMKVVQAIKDATQGIGADVAMEMSGFNSAFNTAIASTRRGGDVILFGISDGPVVLDSFSRLVMNGIALHSVIGRQIFETWTVTRSLLEDRSNRIQDLIWEVILGEGEDTIVDIRDWQKDSFEACITSHPKAIIRFAGWDA